MQLYYNLAFLFFYFKIDSPLKIYILTTVSPLSTPSFVPQTSTSPGPILFLLIKGNLVAKTFSLKKKYGVPCMSIIEELFYIPFIVLNKPEDST